MQAVELDHGLVPRQRPAEFAADAHHGGHRHVVLEDPHDGKLAAAELEGPLGAGHEVHRRARDAQQRLIPDAAPRPRRRRRRPGATTAAAHELLSSRYRLR